ncbi:MAG: PEP-CTERM sorting domain-containing protein [Haliea sp.]|nr:PEP-CTERM sorting domain-containing protein [Haliea sp.]MBK6737775.1 PEP-CTERM sorting domain-containing protein [Haliea sp.]
MIELINGRPPLLALALDHPISYDSLADSSFRAAPRLVLRTVPEPATLWLVLLACACVAARPHRGRETRFRFSSITALQRHPPRLRRPA